MTEISGSSELTPVQKPTQDARLLPAVSRSRAAPAVEPSGVPASPPSPKAATPSDAVEITRPEQVSVAYKIDQKDQQVYIQFVDSKTGALINQVPAPQVLAFEDQIAQYLDSRPQAERAPVAAPGESGGSKAKEG